ncbi:sideroflexin-4 isoform X2 [Dipodomys spectabilis]|uniref:sideroflexin-4 isoform X2 n=1 Tax=Dipodomys spectabilis TaxID=105255 RepID=UPI001C54B3B7|nr:sideroflexin-4 isoform X2 [Dipodomys spectabilis]
MEPNLRFGIWERQSFVQRFLRWTELLDPTNLLISIERIEKSRQLLFTNEDAARHNLNDQRIKEAWKRSLSTVHPDSSRLIPAFFRPAAFLPLTAPMVSFYAYTTAFTIINGNSSYRRHGAEQVVLGTGAFSSSAFLGLFPYFIQTKCPLINPLIKRALPIIFFAQVSAMNVFASRSLEPIRGIQVMDKEGRVIGLSRKAGEKAVRETSISRAVLFGISALIPEVFTYFYKRTLFYLENPWSLWTAKLSCTVLVMGLMVPVSFSMFPQVGRVQSRKLEEEIQSSTEETELFYNRGV